MAGFDPRQPGDLDERRDDIRSAGEGLSEFVKWLAAALPGLPGDVADMVMPDTEGMAGNEQMEQLIQMIGAKGLPTTEDIGVGVLGADPESLARVPGEILSPGPGEIAGALKGLKASLAAGPLLGVAKRGKGLDVTDINQFKAEREGDEILDAILGQQSANTEKFSNPFDKFNELSDDEVRKMAEVWEIDTNQPRDMLQVELAQYGPRIFSPGNQPRINVLDQPRPDAPFPQYADEMMPVPDPVYDYENTVKYPSKLQARKPNPKARQDPKYKDEMFELERTLARQEGRPYTKAWLSKGPSEEADRFLAARQEAQSRIDRGEYTPVYDVDARYDAPGPEVFDRRGETLTDTLAVRPEVIAEHRAKLDPKMKDRIKTAYEHGEKMGGHDRWYAMGQLYDDFVKDFGPEAGPVKFRENFSDAMSATTGGADPKENLVTAGFVNFLRETGRPVPTAAWQMPSPVGGRFISGNVKMGDEVKSGREIGMDEPKRHNFGRSYEGYKDTATMDEQMTTLMTEGKLKAPPDRQYGLYEEPVHELAKEVGNPDVADVQGIVWGGAKDAAEKARAKEKLVNAVAKLDTPAEQAKVTALTNKQQAAVDKAQARVAKEEAFAGQAKTPVQETARAKKVEAAKKSLATALARQDKAMTPAQRAADNARLANETAGHTGKPMIQIWNEMVERTSALTGRSPNEVNRLARAGKIPLYAVGGATVVGAGLGAGQGNEPGGMM